MARAERDRPRTSTRRCWRTITPRPSARKTSTWPGPAGKSRPSALRGKAIWWSRRAAELAIGRYEIDEGLALLDRAVSLESRTPEQAEIWQRIGLACALKYDGERFWQAMQQALDIVGPSAEVYADLALQSVMRGGMWVQEPDWSLVDGWIQQALELAGEGSLAKANALHRAGSTQRRRIRRPFGPGDRRTPGRPSSFAARR